MRITPTFVHLLAFFSLSGICQAASVIHEKRSNLPIGWTPAGRYDSTQVLPLRFGLKQANMDKLDEMLMDVSHPDSSNYGKRWSPTQIAATFAPSTETVDVVRSWLTDWGFAPSRISLSPTKAWIQVNATVEEAERLLQTEYQVYSHTSGADHVGCDAYNLPAHVVPHVDFVTPTIHFDAVLTQRGASGALPAERRGPPRVVKIGNISDQLETCDILITPACLRALYEFEYRPIATSKNSYGIVQYTPQAYLQSDLDMFNQIFSPFLVGKSPEASFIDGGQRNAFCSR